MILELNLNEATIVTYSPEPEYEEYESTEIIIPINNNIKLVISGMKSANNDYTYTIPPMAKFVDLADEDDDELDESILLIGNNHIICESSYIVSNNQTKQINLTDYI